MTQSRLPLNPVGPPAPISRKLRAVRLLVALLVAIFAVLASGCGTDSSSADARRVVQSFYAALQRHDGGAACELLSDDTRSSLETSEKKPCDQAVFSLGLSPSRVVRLRVYVTSAEATLDRGEAVFLDQDHQGWKISAVGCKPQHEQPYDCQLEA
jgi:hypothetical protein